MITNAIQTIMPYRKFGTWVFDDPDVGLVREPFVLGIPEMIDVMIAEAGIANADQGFRMSFSFTRPPQSLNVHHIKLMAEEKGGGWYRDVETRMGGWLCPATLIYFKVFPREMFIWAEKMAESAQSATHAMNKTRIDELGLVPSSTLFYDDREISTEEDWKEYLDDLGLPITTFVIPSRTDN